MHCNQCPFLHQVSSAKRSFAFISGSRASSSIWRGSNRRMERRWKIACITSIVLKDLLPALWVSGAEIAVLPTGNGRTAPGRRPAVHTWNIWQSGYNPGIAPSGRPTHRPVGPQRHCPPCCSARGSSIGCRIAPNCSMWNNLPASGRSTAGIGSGGACSAAPAGSRVRAKGAASTSRTGFCRGRRCAGLRLLIHAKGPSLQSVLRRGAFLVRL